MREPALVPEGRIPMADYDNPVLRGQTSATTLVDQGLRAYMLRVYNYMIVGLVLTGLTAFGVSGLATTTDQALADRYTLGGGLYLTHFGAMLYTSPLQYVVIFAPLAMVFFISWRIHKISAGAAQLAFWIFAALMGVSLSSIFLVYASQSIAQVFFITAGAFGALSLWGYTTKRDLTGMGSFLIMGLFGLIIAMVVNMFLNSPAVMWAISVIGVFVFAGLTAYDTQKIKEIYYAGDDGSVAAKKSIIGALNLYLDFVNMFMFLLRLFGVSRR
jgi:uncharacterized protein